MDILKIFPAVQLTVAGFFFLLLPTSWRTRLRYPRYPWNDIPYSLGTTVWALRGIILTGAVVLASRAYMTPAVGARLAYRPLHFWPDMLAIVSLLVFSRLLARLWCGPSEMNVDGEILKGYWKLSRILGLLLFLAGFFVFVLIKAS